MPVEKLLAKDKCVIENRARNFVGIPNHVAQLYTNWEALGLYAYMQSMPTDWVFYKTVLRKLRGCGRKKIDALFKDLADHNLIICEQVRNENGRFSHLKVIVLDGLSFKYNSLENSDRCPILDPRSTVVPFTDVGERAPIKKQIKQINKKSKAERGLSQHFSSDKQLTKQTECPDDAALIDSEKAEEIADEKGIDIGKEIFRFMAYAKSMGWKRSNWRAAFIKWITDARVDKKSQLPLANQIRSTVQEWGPGHPGWESLNRPRAIN
jgi:hypothetical protein